MSGGGLVYYANDLDYFLGVQGHKGSIWLNRSVTVLGSPGNRYVIMGWQRLTDSNPERSNIAPGVDYVELRVPVGG